MAKTTKTDAVWHNIDVETLPPGLANSHRLYKAAYKAMKDARELFEADMSKTIDPPKGKRVIFGYNFGKLSVAVVDADKATTKPAATLSLADLCKR